MRRNGRQSISQLQARALNNNSLDLIGIGEDTTAPVSLDAVTAALYEVAEEYILFARQNLVNADRVSKGALQDSIIPTNVEVNGEVISIGISVLSYYKFVDKGVKGWKDTSINSPYAFKAPSGRHKGGTSKFVTSIRKWLIREGLTQRASAVGHPKSISRDSKRKAKSKFTDTSTRTAIIIAANIRRRGLQPTHFWSNAEAATVAKMKEKFSLALKIDVINNLTQ